MTCLLLVLFFLSLLSALASAGSWSTQDLESRKDDLYPEILRDEAVARLNELGKVSDAEGYLERTFMSPASVRAGNLIRGWMEDAGLRTWIDHMGNVHGRVDGINASSKAILIGSHLDTVVDAGIFDGSLGVVSAISALKVLKARGKLANLLQPVEREMDGNPEEVHSLTPRLIRQTLIRSFISSSHALQFIVLHGMQPTIYPKVIAFSDEEGIRFQSTFLGSAAVAGILPASALHFSDKSGVTVQEALKENSIHTSEENLYNLKYDRDSVWGYVEVHIEQGPVLEWRGLPLGVVKGIAGQTRLKVTVRGSQGHAGTVPMCMRQDPMSAAAELIVLLESLCKRPEDFLSFDDHCKDSTVQSLSTSLVCTVGEISSWPSASNVIPGQVIFTVDVRAIDDMGREAVIYELSNRMYQICDRRSVSCIIERKHDAGAVMCDDELRRQLQFAAHSALHRMSDNQFLDEVPVLMSGAGHDAMAISHLTKVGMIFVRCRGGVSHSPEEHVLDDDIWAAGLSVLAFLETHM